MKLSLNYIGELLKTAEDLYNNRVDAPTQKRFEEYIPVVKEIFKQSIAVGVPLAAPFLSIGLAYYDRNKNKKSEETIKEFSELLDEINKLNKDQLDDINKNHNVSLNYLHEIQCDVKEIREIAIRTETKVDGLQDDTKEILNILKQSIFAKPEVKFEDKKYIQEIIKNRGYNYIENIINENKKSDAEGFLFEGIAFFYSEKYEDAEEEFRKAINLNPDVAGTHFALAFVLNKLERYDESEEEHKKFIEINPDIAEVHYSLGLLLNDLERYGEAEEEYRKTIELNTEYAEAHRALGILLYDLERYGEAEEEYKKTIELDPEHAEAHRNMGNLLYKLNKYKEAEKEFKKSIELNPKLAEAHNNYGILLQKLNRFEEAEKHYKEALSIDPKYAYAHNNYGNLLVILNQFEEAEKHYKKALKINPEYAEAHINYGNLLVILNKFKKAKKHLKKALKINPECAEAHIKYGILLEISGTIDESVSEFETSIKLLKEQGREEDIPQIEELLNTLIITRELREIIGDDYKNIEFYEIDENGNEILIDNIEKEDNK